MMDRNRRKGDRRERNYRRFDHRDGRLNNIKEGMILKYIWSGRRK